MGDNRIMKVAFTYAAMAKEVETYKVMVILKKSAAVNRVIP